MAIPSRNQLTPLLPPSPPRAPFRARRWWAAVGLHVILALPAIHAQTYYFDVNGTTTGSGVTSGSYTVTSTSTVWNPNASGTSTPVAWTGTTSTMAFSAGTDASGSQSIQFSGFNPSLGGLTQQEGIITLSGGDLIMGTSATFTVASLMTIQNVIGESTAGTSFTKSGAGTLTLSGQNTFTGNLNVNQGTLISDAGAFGFDSSVNLSIARGATLALTTYGQWFDSIEGAGNLVLDSLAYLSVGDDSALKVFSGVISGGSAIEKTGTGTLLLSGNNTTAADITVSAGTLAVGHANGLGSTSAGTTVAGGATLDLQNVALAAESIALNGSATLATSTGSSSLSAGLTLNAGDSTIAVTGTSLAIGTTVSGPGGFHKTGGDTLTLGGNNTFTGSTYVDGGTLAVTSANGLGTTHNGTTVQAGATLDLRNVALGAEAIVLNNNSTLATSTGSSSLAGSVSLTSGSANIAVAGTVLSLDGAISGSGGLTKTGAGEVILNHTGNNYTGATIINEGTLSVGRNGGVIANTGTVTIGSAGTLNVGSYTEGIGGLAGSGSVNLGTGALNPGSNNANTTFSGVIYGAGALNEVGSGTLTLSGANTYTGNTNINSGTLKIGANGVMPSTSAVTVAAGATFNLDGYSASIGSLAGVGNVALGPGTLTTGAKGTNTTFSGTISGSGSLQKNGAGTLTLNGANTLTGSVQVIAGTLSLAATNVLATASSVTVAAGATLFSGTTQSLNSLSGDGRLILAGGTLTLTSASSIGTLHVTANSVLDCTGSFSVQNLIVDAGVTLSATNQFLAANWWADANMNVLVARNVSGTTPYNQVSITAYPGTASATHWDSYDYVTPVPEPATYGAGLVALTLTLVMVRRRRKP